MSWGLCRALGKARMCRMSQWRCYSERRNTLNDRGVPLPFENKKERHPDQEKEPLPEWPDGVNPHTGERGGPKGPEPTRYGDWERKGRVTDF